jgi:hypothetical protein
MCEKMSKRNIDNYITIVPSGVENVAANVIRDELSCRKIEILSENDLCDRDKLESYKTQLIRQIKKKKLKQNAKQKIKEDAYSISNNPNCSSKDSSILSEEIHGSIKINYHGHEKEISIGYHDSETIISSPGALEGKKLVEFQTDAPPKCVASLRPMGYGPLLVKVLTFDFNTEENVFSYEKPLDETIASFTKFMEGFGEINYQKCFEKALRTWHQHVIDVWCESKDVQNFWMNNDESNSFNSVCILQRMKESLHRKVIGRDVCYYRVSCMRSYTNDYSYNRDDLIPHLVDKLIPGEVNLYSYVKTDNFNEPFPKKKMKFAVDLTKYDFEVVLFIHDNIMNISIALCPYQYLGAKSFANGKMPPNISPPYITGETSTRIVRLRPSIASLLCHIARVKKGDLILDPCAGVGTIPVEASFLGNVMTCFGLGGDIAISKSGGGGENFSSMIVNYFKQARDCQRDQLCGKGGSDVLSWDATSIPIRDSVIDCIISDLPFGLKCMSAKTLNSFLPLLFSECARLLRRKSGRMTLLCGSSYKSVLDAIMHQTIHNGGDLKNFFVITSIFPVNIGGISAWIIQATRNDVAAVRIKNHRARQLKLTKLRAQQNRQGSKRILQA